MEINDFIEKFVAQFDDTEGLTVTAQTRFRDELGEWDSLKAMSIIAVVDEEYGVMLKGDDIKNCNTIEDVFLIVQSRK